MKETNGLHTSSLYFCLPFLMDEGCGLFPDLPSNAVDCNAYSFHTHI